MRAPGHDPQIRVCKENGVEYLLYTEDFRSKTNQGGLSGHRHIPKTVKVVANPDFDRDPVCLYKKYIGLLPNQTKTSALYRYPLSVNTCTPTQWFSEKPIGVNSLKKIVGNLIKEAGLSGKYSNHSWRALAATHMFQGGGRTGDKRDNRA